MLCRGLLHKEPNFRLGCRRVGPPEDGAEEMKAHPFFATGDSITGREPVPWKKMEAGKVSLFYLFLRKRLMRFIKANPTILSGSKSCLCQRCA